MGLTDLLDARRNFQERGLDAGVPAWVMTHQARVESGLDTQRLTYVVYLGSLKHVFESMEGALACLRSVTSEAWQHETHGGVISRLE